MSTKERTCTWLLAAAPGSVLPLDSQILALHGSPECDQLPAPLASEPYMKNLLTGGPASIPQGPGQPLPPLLDVIFLNPTLEVFLLQHPKEGTLAGFPRPETLPLGQQCLPVGRAWPPLIRALPPSSFPELALHSALHNPSSHACWLLCCCLHRRFWSLAGWHAPAISLFVRPRLGNLEFKTSLSYLIRL